MNQSFQMKCFFSPKLQVYGNVYDIIEAYNKYINKYLESNREEYEIKLDEYRKIDEGKWKKNIKMKVRLPIHQFLHQ